MKAYYVSRKWIIDRRFFTPRLFLVIVIPSITAEITNPVIFFTSLSLRFGGGFFISRLHENIRFY